MSSAVVQSPVVEANSVGVAAARLAGVPLVMASVRNLSVWKRTRERASAALLEGWATEVLDAA